MGLYLEPIPQEKKMEWIKAHGKRIPFGTFLDYTDFNLCSVVFMDNGPFQALAFAFNPREAHRLTSRVDGVWYAVKVEYIRDLLPSFDFDSSNES